MSSPSFGPLLILTANAESFSLHSATTRVPMANFTLSPSTLTPVSLRSLAGTSGECSQAPNAATATAAIAIATIGAGLFFKASAENRIFLL